MTQTTKPIRPEPFASQVLKDHELEAVSGGGTMLSSAVSNTIKNFGAALQSAARAG